MGNYTYKSKSDYEAAMRDQKRIDAIKSKFDLSKQEDVEKIYQMLAAGTINFESNLGSDFDDNIYKLYKAGKEKNESKNSGIKGKQKRKITKNNIDTKNEKNNISNSTDKRTENQKKIKLDDFDEDMQQEIVKELGRRERKRRFYTYIAMLIAVVCLGYFVFYYITASKSENRWSDISELIGSDVLSNSVEKTTVTATLSSGDKIEVSVLPKYETLYNSNRRLIGWIKIADTNIDYPVMQCDNNTYYLDHNFDQEEDSVGALFLDYQCDVIEGSDNFIIYGHHLRSGKMFSSLSNYESESYYNRHKYIDFDTIYEEGTYQVMYAFRSRVYNAEDVVFKYYQFINANSEEEFNSYMKEMSELSYYDTGVTARYGDQLLTLSTCDYNETNGRFVVVAKKID